MTLSTDTIFAVATAAGRSGIAVIRVSGDAAGEAVSRCTAGALPTPRRVTLRHVLDPQTAEIIDQALVLWMPAPASFTGEDVAEFHLHGGLAVRKAVLAALACCPDFRPAEPGEFTRRAFMNGKLDLDEVEGLSDLIDAETEAQRRQALRQFGGALRQAVEGWRDQLIDASALIEASLDFTDEDDVPSDLDEPARRLIAEVETGLERALRDARSGERLRDGFHVVLTGPPNAGKSTLLNRLAQRDIAIVSPVAGTTRDAIEVRCDLGGLPVTFVDTAGLRPTTDTIEMAGIARTLTHANSADLVLRLTAVDAGPETHVGEETVRVGVPSLAVWTKIDLGFKLDLSASHDGETLAVSAETGEGIADLIERLRLVAEQQIGAGDALLTRERHRTALTETAVALGRAGDALQRQESVLAAEDLRLALRALGRISGRVDVDDILDRIFGQFCIGK